MPRDGSGVYSRTNGNFNGSSTWAQQAGSGDNKINSGRHDTHDNDLGQALTDSLDRTGKGGMQADLAMGNNRITGLGNATARTDAVSAGQVQDNGLSVLSNVGGTGDAITADATPAITAYTDGQSFQIKLATTNTTDGVTIAINGLSAIPIKTGTGGDIPAGNYVSGDVRLLAIDGGGTQAIDVFADYASLPNNNIFTGANKFNGALASGPGDTLTIATDNIVPTGNDHRVDTEASAATDDLVTIDTSFTGNENGTILKLRSADASRVVTVKHNASPSAGQISLADGKDYELGVEKSLTLYISGGVWYEQSRSEAQQVSGGKIIWTAGTPSVAKGNNIASLGDLGVGDVRITWTTAFPDANYTLLATAFNPTNAYAQVIEQTAANCRILVYNPVGGGSVDPSAISVTAQDIG